MPATLGNGVEGVGEGVLGLADGFLQTLEQRGFGFAEECNHTSSRREKGAKEKCSRRKCGGIKAARGRIGISLRRTVEVLRFAQDDSLAASVVDG